MKQLTQTQASWLYQKVRKSIVKNHESDIFYKAFLKPNQIALKTSDTEKDPHKAGCMPYGIKQVIRPNPSDNRFLLQDFHSIETKIPNFLKQGQTLYEEVKQKKCDNLISLLKPSNPANNGIKVAICICMYSEDKSMLKRTLSGVSQNIQTFVKNGYAYDDIGVFVIMDGIQVVDPSVQQLFQQLEKQHNIYLGDDVEPARQQQILDKNRQIEDEQIDNFNHLIFIGEQFQEYKMRRFIERKKEYKEHKDMIKNIEKMQKDKNISYDSLDYITQKFFLEQAKQQYKKDYAATDDDLKFLQESVILQKYTQSKKISTPIIKQALNQSKKYCQQYITSRDNLAIMTTFRTAITLPSYSQHEGNPRGQQYVDLNDDSASQRLIHMNLFFVTKYKNRGKLTSHNWFFNGFCVELNPMFAILLDVGLVPEKDSLYKMCSYMKNNQTVGGVCGYMGLRIQRLQDKEEISDETVDCITSLSLKLFDIQRAQQFEYHFAHLIDKPFESSCCFKFIHVLPGAFSGYRMKALRPESNQEPKILREYFKSIEGASTATLKAQPYSLCKTISKVLLPDFLFFRCFKKPDENSYEKVLYDENVYLAEDRTLCMGIHQNGFDLAYLPDAGAWVDPMKTLYGMLGQRKRWINGSYFAFQKVKQTLQQSEGDCCLKIQIAYLTLMNWLGFIAPALFMYTIHIAMYTFQTNVIVQILKTFGLVNETIANEKNNVVGIFVYLIDLIYVLIFLGLVFFSMHLTNREPKFRSFFYGVSTVYGIFSMSVFGVLIYDIISGFTTKNSFLIENPWFVQSIPGGQNMINSLRFIMLAIMGLYAIPVFVSMTFCKFQYIVDILFSTFSFVFYSPTYLNILNIYALCRMDDISWGTKGLNTDSSGRNKQMLEDWKKIKLLHVSKFVLYNIVTGFLLLLFGDEYKTRFWLTFSIMVTLIITLGLKVILGTIYLLTYRICVSESAKEQSMQPIANHVEKKFQKVKKSLYTQIEKQILGIQKQCKNGNEEIPIANAVLSSTINFHVKFKRDGKPKFKKQTNNWENLNQSYRESMSKIIKNSSKPALLKPIAEQNYANTEQHNTTLDKFSDNSSAGGKREEVHIVPTQEQNKKKQKFKKSGKGGL